jgi:hypothetical protein
MASTKRSSDSSAIASTNSVFASRSTERRYRDRRSFPIPVWNGIFEHADRIGEAIWEFLWCIDAITREKNGEGAVFGGAPVKVERISSDLNGSDRESVRRHLKKLESKGYIRLRRTPYGHIIWVQNSKKFNIWRKEKPQKTVSPPEAKLIGVDEIPSSVDENPQNTVCNKDSALTLHKDSAKADAVAVDVLVGGHESEEQAENRRPPLDPETQNWENESDSPVSKNLPGQDTIHDRDRKYSESVDKFRETILTKFVKNGYDRVFINLVLDEIDQRAWDGGTRIASEAYFDKSIENSLGDRAAVDRINTMVKAGHRSLDDVDLEGPVLSPSAEKDRQIFNSCILARGRELLDLREATGTAVIRDGRNDRLRIDFTL